MGTIIIMEISLARVESNAMTSGVSDYGPWGLMVIVLVPNQEKRIA